MYLLINTYLQLNAAAFLFSHHLETCGRNRYTKSRETKKLSLVIQTHQSLTNTWQIVRKIDTSLNPTYPTRALNHTYHPVWFSAPGHSTIHQIHRLTDTIASALERRQYCAGLFLDVAQAFDKVWHDGLLFKLKKFMPAQLFLVIKSFLEN